MWSKTSFVCNSGSVPCENACASDIGNDGDFAYVQVGCGHVTIKREGNRIVLVAGPGCQLAVSGNIDTVSVVVSSKEVGKP
jgi:hypothetical protein